MSVTLVSIRAAQDLPESHYDVPARPGLAACESEWLLAYAAHKLGKLTGTTRQS